MDNFDFVEIEKIRIFYTNPEKVYQKLLIYLKSHPLSHESIILEKLENQQIITRYNKITENETEVRFYYIVLKFSISKQGNNIMLSIELAFDPDQSYNKNQKNTIRRDWLYLVEDIGKAMDADISDLQRRIHSQKNLEGDLGLIWHTIAVFCILVSPFFFYEIDQIYLTIFTLFVLLVIVLSYVYWNRKRLLKKLYFT